MNDFMTITAKLKTILAQTKCQTVYDRDVALALDLTPSSFASMKRRQTIPYRAILDYCVRNHINADTLLLCRPANNLIAGPDHIHYDDPAHAGSGSTITRPLFIRRLDANASCSY